MTNTNPARISWAKTAACVAVLGVLAHANALAGTSIGFGSSVAATNQTSSGDAMHDEFVFQLGTFIGDFVPTSSNTDLWLENWREVSDREGEPLEGNTAPYLTRELGVPFPAGTRANSFSSSVLLEHNEPPFDMGGQLYIWGYDHRATPGAAEWILISDASWMWPDGSVNLPAQSYAVSSASTSVVGEILGDGFEMKSASVTVPDSSGAFYEGWLASNFSAEVLGDASLEASVWGDHADPDKDGLSNLMEYFTGRDPNVAAAVAVLGDPAMAGDSITMEFERSKSAVGVVGQVEWSADLKSWSRSAIEESVVGDDGEFETVQVTWPLGEVSRAYFRVTVERAP